MSIDKTHEPGAMDTKQTAEKVASDTAQSLKSTAQDAKEKITAEAGTYANQAKEAAADEVKDVASALRAAADDLRSGSPQERTFSQIADGLADASEAIRNKDLGEVVGDLNGFARRNPLVFLGGAALLGFVATRFAKASEHGSQPAGTAYQTGQTRGNRLPPRPEAGMTTAQNTDPRPVYPSATEGEKV